MKTAGRTRSVATVASAIPPITARASGAFCSLPSSNPSDIGIIPAIMAQPVMMIGRSRPLAAVMAARSAGMPSSRRWRSAKLTSMIAFETATPTAMIAPMNDSMFSVDARDPERQHDAREDRRHRSHGGQGQPRFLEVGGQHDQDHDHGHEEADLEESNISRMGPTWPRSSTSVPLGGCPARMMAASSRSITRPRSSPSMLAVRLR